jgi:putative RNA 2'-phosphotransferase
MSRHHVHLSPDAETAATVGSRRGKPVILQIAAGEMAEAGHQFMQTGNDVWLAETVPPEFIRVPAASRPADRAPTDADAEPRTPSSNEPEPG